MPSEVVGDGVGQGTDVEEPAVLGRGKDEPAAKDLALSDDVHHPRVQLDVVDGQAERLALPESAAGAESDEQSVPLRQRFLSCDRARRAPRDSLRVLAAGGG